ncbi:hypothetical protein [Thermodesulfitimonas sp.]
MDKVKLPCRCGGGGRVVRPYCGTPADGSSGVCRGCGSDLEPNRTIYDPVSQAWQAGRGWRRLPRPGELMGGLVRWSLLVTGLFFLVPALFSLVLGLTMWFTRTGSCGPLALVVSAVGVAVGSSLCCQALRRK